ncbi:MAG: hypothetical protein A2Y76_02960 [Planctomycetes bacterium RBG_13_60_9]|nr:MAG: hypothetical protein A2Y76_02960 [Planctomycetes bacterium RBG_13_60_9]
MRLDGRLQSVSCQTEKRARMENSQDYQGFQDFQQTTGVPSQVNTCCGENKARFHNRIWLRRRVMKSYLSALKALWIMLSLATLIIVSEAENSLTKTRR